MIKKLSVMLLATAMLAFAQDPYSSNPYAPAPTEESPYEDMSAYTSGAPAPETPVVNINEVPNDEPVFFISIHPLSLSIMSILGLPTFFVTLEACLTESMSGVVRPMYLFSTFDLSVDDDEFEISEYGLTLGLRYYWNPLHRGVYIEPELQYAHISMGFNSGRHKDDSVSGDGIGLGAVMGYKITSGHFSMFMDIGFVYTFVNVSGEFDDDVEEVASIGGAYDFNLGVGYAF
ncbi:DUF3575 domain-containing protein [Fibrobacter sp.]|uniref:DUF3575 domain-containing protein n=1 Tax=Fibrobacter sp. TaxID=35828 RepID=UPI00388F6FC6